MNKHYVALLTPFSEKGINFEALDNLMDYVSEGGAKGAVLLGTTGEASTVTDRERISLIKYAVRNSKGMEIIVGCSSNCTAVAAKNALLAEKLGADGILAITPYYNKCNDEGAYLHFKAIMNAAKLPVIVYNVPARTGYNLSVDTAQKLMEEANMAGVKEAGSIKHAIDFIVKGVPVYCGEDALTIPFTACGAVGTISVVSNLLPTLVNDILKEKSVKCLHIMDEICNLMFSDVNPIPVKCALNLLGFNVGTPRLPLTPLSAEKTLSLKKWMSSHSKLFPKKYRTCIE